MEIIDQSYFNELIKASPQTLCRNNRCNYDERRQSYAVNIWGWQYIICPVRSSLEVLPSATERPHEYLALFCIYYLLRKNDITLSGTWVSEKDFPGGPTFFRGPHLIPTDDITKRFGNDLLGFCTRCEQLGGKRLEMADAAFLMNITPDIPVAVLYWIGDEDFPAEARILYDRSITELLTLDILFALAVGVCDRIGKISTG